MEKRRLVMYYAFMALLAVLYIGPVVGEVSLETPPPPRSFDVSEEKRIANEDNVVAKKSLTDSQIDEQVTNAPSVIATTEQGFTSQDNDALATESPTTPNMDVKPTDSAKAEPLTPEEGSSGGSNTTVIIVIVLFIFTNLIKGVPVIIAEVLMRKARNADDKDFNSGGKRLENDDSSNSLSEVVNAQASGSSSDLKKGDTFGKSKARDYEGIDNVAFTAVIVNNSSAAAIKAAVDTRQSTRARKQKVMPLERRELHNLDNR